MSKYMTPHSQSQTPISSCEGTCGEEMHGSGVNGESQAVPVQTLATLCSIQPSPTIPGPGWWLMLSGVLQLFMDTKLNRKLPQSFTFAFTNIRGLLSNIDHLNLFLCQQAPILFACSETKLSNKFLDSELAFPNYTI